MKGDRLQPRQLSFVREYLVDLNATKAAIRAGYSERGASVTGVQLLGNPKIKALIDESLQKRAERVEVRADDVLRELVRVANADLRKAFNDDGTLKPVREWPDDVAAFISSVESESLYKGRGRKRQEVGTVKKIKLWPKVQALELLGKHLKLFADRLEHTGKDGGPIQAQQQVELKNLTEAQLEFLAGIVGQGKASEPK